MKTRVAVALGSVAIMSGCIARGRSSIASAPARYTASTAPISTLASPGPRPVLSAPVATPPKSLYPYGQKMAVGLYSVDDPNEIPTLANMGFSLFHTYSTAPGDVRRLADAAANAGVFVMGTIPKTGAELTSGPLTDAQKTAISQLVPSPAIPFWDLPEEPRWDYPDEVKNVDECVSYLKTHDPLNLPRFEYLPGHYTADEVAKYVATADIVPASLYPRYEGQPYAWSRWRMESIVAGIHQAGAAIGPDYLHGQRTPFGLIELFKDDCSDPSCTNFQLDVSPEGAYHDFWQALVSGAQGLIIYSYAHRSDTQHTLAAWNALQEATKELTGSDHLDKVLLWGTKVPGIGVAVTAGPVSTPTFHVPMPNSPDTISYPSLDFTTRVSNGTVYVFVVNSAESTVSAEISGLPLNSTNAEVLFSSEKPVIANHSLSLNLKNLGVKVLRLTSS